MEKIIDFYKNLDRLGPGSEEQTKKALAYIQFPDSCPKIADIGCGTGAQTEILAKETNAEIVAVDFLDDFLVYARNRFAGTDYRIETLCADMSNLPFRESEFDLIFSEGAIYNIGFDKGSKEWRRFLKPNGYLAVTELSWLTGERPEEITAYFANAYAEVDTIGNKVMQLEKNGYRVVSHFALPPNCWEANYYEPIRANIEPFLNRWERSTEAQEFVDEVELEMEMYKKYQKYYGYVFFIAQKTE